MKIDDRDSLVAVIVSYHPETATLCRLLDSLGPQVGSILIVDNGTGESLSKYINSRGKPNEILIRFAENRGLAAAYNAGIEWASKHCKRYIIFFDQDSLPGRDMVFHLLSAMEKLTSMGFKTAAVGPVYIDARNKDLYSFIRVNGLEVFKFGYGSHSGIIESDIVISSGSLIPIDALEEIGGPLNQLFIDNVDLEWCFRARSCGYRVFGSFDAVLNHSLGDSPKWFLGKTFVHHNPLRHYYIFRNSIWLMSKAYVPVGWKLLFVRGLIFRFFFNVGFVSPRMTYLAMMLKGLKDGVAGRMGKL